MKQAAGRLSWRSFVTFGTALALIALAGCSSNIPVATAGAASQAQPTPQVTAPPPPSAQPSDPPQAAPVQPSASSLPVQPTTVVVAFSGVRAGIYTVHLHSRCNGRQAFHLTVLQSLRVSSGRSGSIGVPSQYFGRGLCLIVYSNASLSVVLTTRAI